MTTKLKELYDEHIQNVFNNVEEDEDLPISKRFVYIMLYMLQNRFIRY